MMAQNMTQMLSMVKECNDKVKRGIEEGLLEPVLEVEPGSFIQVLAAKPLVANQMEPVTWQYFQYWVDTLPKETQDKLIGAFLGERVGMTKIIGIFNAKIDRGEPK